MLMALLANIHLRRDKSDHVFQPDEFMPYAERDADAEPKAQRPGADLELRERLRAAAAATGGIQKRRPPTPGGAS